MSDRIIEGYWDCTYCGRKAIGGLTKTCPSCGHPQGENIKFYMKKDKKLYLDDEQAKDYGKGADWQCDFCGSYNRYNITKCRNCGSSKYSSKKDYFERYINQPENTEKSNTLAEEQDSYNFNSIDDKKDNDIQEKHEGFTSKFNLETIKKKLIIGSVIFSFIALLLFIFLPREYNASVFSNSWSRSVTIESYDWVDDNSWYSAPAEARDVSYKNEIHHYDQVLDHYETEIVQKSREVYDHTEYEEHVSYSDNGDGTFTEHTYTNQYPVYRTEYYTQEEQKPVYVSVPVYEKKYYYQIQKWVFNRTKTASGVDEYEFYWPEYLLRENERVSSKNEKYTLVFISTKENKKYKADVPENYLSKFKINQTVSITVQGEFITKINGEKIIFN